MRARSARRGPQLILATPQRFPLFEQLHVPQRLLARLRALLLLADRLELRTLNRKRRRLHARRVVQSCEKIPEGIV